MSPLSRTQRAGLLAIAAQVTAILEQDEAERATEALGPPAPIASTDPAVCEHPADKRVPAAGMGSPNATVCSACQSRVEG